MDKRYTELFTLISQSVSNLAEQVMNDHQDKGEDKQQETAQIMRDDYLNLHDKLTNGEALDKADFARLLVGAIIVTNQLDARIKNEQKALDGYKIDIEGITRKRNEEEIKTEDLTLYVIDKNIWDN